MNPYGWKSTTVVKILKNRQYTGCTVNFKSTTVSYKVHKKIYNPTENQQIIPNTQEAIISKEIQAMMDEVRKNPQKYRYVA